LCMKNIIFGIVLCFCSLSVFSQESDILLKETAPLVAPTNKDYVEHKEKSIQRDGEAYRKVCQYESDIKTEAPKRVVSLTFDDGPGPGTEKVLDILKKHNIKATFFMVGMVADKLRPIVERVSAEGHIIGNHSWSHPNFHMLSNEKQKDEIFKADAAVYKNTTQVGKFFRYPFGNSSCFGNKTVRDMGYKIVGWHVDSCDWAFDATGRVSEKEANVCGVIPRNTGSLLSHILYSVHSEEGGIILMHDIHARTISILEPLIVALKSEGYSFERVDGKSFERSLN
jgi:peptidoglycan-N-acetylglucosamine deacetylase